MQAKLDSIDIKDTTMGNTDSKKDKCCPIVVDPLTFTALLGGIAAATFFLNTLITMNITKKRRRRRDLLSDGPGTSGLTLMEEADQAKARWWEDSIAFLHTG